MVDVPSQLEDDVGMSTLARIQKAVASLPPEQKQELMLFLAVRMRAAGVRLPKPRRSARKRSQSKSTTDKAARRRSRQQD
jgi:dsDNA-binding SOS-regulon protein